MVDKESRNPRPSTGGQAAASTGNGRSANADASHSFCWGGRGSCRAVDEKVGSAGASPSHL